VLRVARADRPGHRTRRARYGAARATVAAPRRAPPRPTSLPPLPSGWLDPGTGSRLLGAFRIPAAQGQVCADAAEAAAAAGRFGFPVVAKGVHPSLVHKSEARAVRLDLADPEAVRAAAAELLALAPGAAVLVQPQVTGIELLVGGVRDREFGPVVMVGLGGIHAEVLDDVALGVAPLSVDEARRLVARLRGHALLIGARGAEPVNLDAVCALVSAVGDLLVAVPEIAELDLNPVMVTASGCVAVDWRVRVRNRPHQDEYEDAVSPSHAGETRDRRT
jgi:succinyl-CoA synthetase beta subunit